MLQEILSKTSITDEDMKVIMANFHELSESDRERLGLNTPVSVEEAKEDEEEVAAKIVSKRKKLAE